MTLIQFLKPNFTKIICFFGIVFLTFLICRGLPISLTCWYDVDCREEAKNWQNHIFLVTDVRVFALGCPEFYIKITSVFGGRPLVVRWNTPNLIINIIIWFILYLFVCFTVLIYNIITKDGQVNQRPQFQGPTQKSKFNLKYILFILILTIIVSGGILAYTKYVNKQIVSIIKSLETVNLPSKVPATGGWQTYRNDEYGFEIKYPENHIVFLSDDEPHSRPIPGYFYVSFGTTKNRDGISYKIDVIDTEAIEKYFSEPIEEYSMPNITYDLIFGINFLKMPQCYRPIKIMEQNNINWNISHFYSSQDMCSFILREDFIKSSVVHKNYLYEISFYNMEEERINQILSTFKFIK